MNGDGRLYLRRSVGPLSANTLLTRRGVWGDDADTVTVSRWGDPDLVYDVPRDAVIVRRPRGGAVRPAPPTYPRARQPLVFATPAAAEQGAQHHVGSVENVVREALLQHGASRDPGGGVAIVDLDADGLTAVVTRAKSRTTGRKAWLVVGVRRQPAPCDLEPIDPKEETWQH